MHYWNTITGLLLVLSGSGLFETADARRCFGGFSLNKKVMKDHAKRACEGYRDNGGHFINGRFQGRFGPNESKKVCVPVPDSYGRVNMEVKNTNSRDGFDLNDQDCTKELYKLIDNCLVALGPLARGGEDTVSGWYFKADANEFATC